MGGSKSSSKREVYSNTILLQQTRKNQMENLTLHLKQPEKEQQPKKKKKKKLSRGKKS